MTNNKAHSISVEKSYASPATVILNFFRDQTVFKFTGADVIESDFTAGGLFCLTFNNRGTIHGTFIKITGNEIVLEWNVEGFGRPSEINTRVEINIMQENERCILKLDHKNIIHAEAANAKQKAWTEIFEDMETHLLSARNAK